MRRGLAAVALVCLVALAGCSMLPGTSDSGAPGVEDGELTDSEALLDAHVEELTSSGYAHELNVSQRVGTGENRTESTRRQRTSVAADATEYQFQLINDGRASSRFLVWGNETVEYQSIEAGGSREFRRSDPTPPESLAGAALLEPHLTAPYEVEEVEERDGPNIIRLEATGQPSDASAFPNEATDVSNYEAELVIDERGRILAFGATAEYQLNGEPADYQLNFELTATSDPGVERPGWVDDLES
ncbi:MAG: hypothetical protein ACI8U4_001312 [Natronomonas sp.]|jgi:hypothetical protein